MNEEVTIFTVSSPREVIEQKVGVNGGEVICLPYMWGVCTSDLKTFLNGKGKYFGHEMILRVKSSTTPEYKAGDYVIPLHTSPYDKCGTFLDVGYQLEYKFEKNEIVHLLEIEEIQVMENLVFLDTVSCVVHAIKKLKLTKIKSSKKIAILGTGFVAKIFSELLFADGFQHINLYDRQSIYKEGGIDEGIVIDTTGSFEAINQFLDRMTRKETLLLFANTAFNKVNISTLREADGNLLFSKYFEIKDFRDALKILSTMKIDLTKWVNSTSYSSTALTDALYRMSSKETVREVIHFGG